MSHILLISNIFPGGDGSDNPIPLKITNYDLSPAEKKLKLKNFNVVAHHTPTNAQKQVTGKVIVDPKTNKPKTGPNDVVFLPCTPFCYL
jgi:hypothetical protein